MLPTKETDRISVEMENLIYKECETKCPFDIRSSISGGHPITEDAWVFHARFGLGWTKPTSMSEEELEELFSRILKKIGLRLFTFAFGKYDERWFIELTATQYRKIKYRRKPGTFISSRIYKKEEENNG